SRLLAPQLDHVSSRKQLVYRDLAARSNTNRERHAPEIALNSLLLLIFLRRKVTRPLLQIVLVSTLETVLFGTVQNHRAFPWQLPRTSVMQRQCLTCVPRLRT